MMFRLTFIKNVNDAQGSSGPESQRLDFIDAMRFVAMFQMLQGHTLDSLVMPTELDITSFPWITWHYLRSLTAPMFLVLSGMVNALAIRRNEDGTITAKTIRRRILWAVGLSVLAYYLVLPARNISGLAYATPDSWSTFCQVHILQLNAISLLFLTALAVFTRSDRTLARYSLCACVIIILLTPYVYSVDWFAILPEPLAAYMTPVRGSIFPVFPYAAFLFLGVAIGIYLKNVPVLDAFKKFRNMAPKIALFSLALGGVLCFAINDMPIARQYGAGAWETFLRIGGVLSVLWIIGTIFSCFTSLTTYLASLGRRSLLVFVAHIILLYGLPYTLGITGIYNRNCTLAEGLLAAMIVLTVCFGLAAISNAIRNRYKPAGDIFRFAVAAFVLIKFFV